MSICINLGGGNPLGNDRVYVGLMYRVVLILQGRGNQYMSNHRWVMRPVTILEHGKVPLLWLIRSGPPGIHARDQKHPKQQLRGPLDQYCYLCNLVCNLFLLYYLRQNLGVYRSRRGCTCRTVAWPGGVNHSKLAQFANILFVVTNWFAGPFVAV